MAEWYCFKCKEKMIEKDIWLTYLEITRPVPGIRCPKCGEAYISEKEVIETIGPGEDQIGAKF